MDIFEEITELEPKYLVLKHEDIDNFLTDIEQKQLREITIKIALYRQRKGKKNNEYVILNLDDEFATNYLNHEWQEYIINRMMDRYHAIKVKEPTIRDIATMLVNAILYKSHESQTPQDIDKGDDE